MRSVSARCAHSSVGSDISPGHAAEGPASLRALELSRSLSS